MRENPPNDKISENCQNRTKNQNEGIKQDIKNNKKAQIDNFLLVKS